MKDNIIFTSCNQECCEQMAWTPRVLAIIGAGNMGSMFADNLLEPSAELTQSLRISNRSIEKLQRYSGSEVVVSPDNKTVVSGAEAVLLAVKPQELNAVLHDIQPVVDSNQLVLSIAAGISINTIKHGLGHQEQPVVRMMPNTPAKVGFGITGWMASREVTPKQKDWVRKLLNTCGEEVEVDHEKLIDAVTAISGSGPAYYFRFTESLIHAGVKLGLSQGQAEKLARMTHIGSAALQSSTGETPIQLRSAVTSKGGTTEAALQYLEQNGFDKLVHEVTSVAFNRAQELRAENRRRDGMMSGYLKGSQ